MSEMRALSHMHYAGLPLTMHPIFVSGKGEINGLRSPGAKIVEYGDGVSVGLGYWGSLVCRAGMMLGAPDETYFEHVVTPYFRAIATWYQTLRVGIPGGEVFQAVDQAFGASPLRPALNPGHLTSFDEWVHSPIRPDSGEKIRSGMVFQCDIIPTPLPPGQLMNCEDTVAMADASLRAEIRAQLSGAMGAHAAASPIHQGSTWDSVGRRAAAAHRRHRLPAALLAGERVGLHRS